jgi:hypothetical protein
MSLSKQRGAGSCALAPRGRGLTFVFVIGKHTPDASHARRFGYTNQLDSSQPSSRRSWHDSGLQVRLFFSFESLRY